MAEPVTVDERTRIAESLLALAFSLRTSNDEAGQAWVLSIASTTMARAILAAIGPQGDPEDLLALAAKDVRDIVTTAQTKYFKDNISRGVAH